MNGRALLFSRCLIGLLAYFLCGLAHARVEYKHEGTGRTTTDPVSFTKGLSSNMGDGLSLRDTSVVNNSCPTAPVGSTCSVMITGTLLANGNTVGNSDYRFNAVFLKYFVSDCDTKKDKSAGTWDVPVPGAKIVNGEVVMTDRSSVVNFAAAGFPTCDGTCSMVINGKPSGEFLKSDYSNGLAYVAVNLKYTGEECTLSPDDKKPPKPSPTTPKDPSPKPPKGPSDCPPKTTYGEVNGVKMCVKNAPLPTDPSPPPKPGDKDTCIGNCDKWDPDAPKPTDPKDPKPTDPKDPSTGGTTPATKGPLSSDASKPASENASGPADSSLAASCTDFKCKNKDPATCEIARLAWNNKCIAEKNAEDLEKSSLLKAGNLVLDGKGLSKEDTDALGLTGKENQMDMEGMINQKDVYLPRGGLSDLSFTVQGHSFALPFSKLNRYLKIAGNICVIFSLLFAIRVLVSSI